MSSQQRIKKNTKTREKKKKHQGSRHTVRTSHTRGHVARMAARGGLIGNSACGRDNWRSCLSMSRRTSPAVMRRICSVLGTNVRGTYRCVGVHVRGTMTSDEEGVDGTDSITDSTRVGSAGCVHGTVARTQHAPMRPAHDHGGREKGGVRGTESVFQRRHATWPTRGRQNKETALPFPGRARAHASRAAPCQRFGSAQARKQRRRHGVHERHVHAQQRLP
jgi:hypothetical protein